MPHIEEGELHALLDGAYAHDGPAAARIREEIASCAECRARFDEAQAMRMRASAILGRAQPSTTAPPFDAVLQRAEIVDAPRRFRFPTGARLAWAATIVLALGIGWFGRDRLYSGKVSTSAELDAAARTKNEPVAQSTAPTTVQPGAPSAGAPAEAAPPVQPRANTTALPPPPAPPPSERAAAAAANRRLAAADANVREERADKFAERKEAENSEKAKLRDESQRKSENAVTQSAAAPDTGRARFAQSAEKAVPQAAPAPARAEASALVQADSAWQYVTLEEAERITGRRVLRIPGFQVETVGVSGNAGRFVTRATQRMPDGAMIEIVQQPTPERGQRAADALAGAGAGAAPPTAKDVTGATVLTLTRNGWLLTGRGTLSVDSLRVLLNNAR